MSQRMIVGLSVRLIDSLFWTSFLMDSLLVYLLHNSLADDPTRSLAGLILKNNVRVHWDNFHATTHELIKNECVTHIGDRAPLIRATIGILITTIVGKGELSICTPRLPSLPLVRF